MKRTAALLIAICMATTGCATYQGARKARNAGIVMGVLGVAAAVGGTALTSQNDEPCPNDGNGCAITAADVYGFMLIMTAVALIPYGLVFGFVGAAGMEKHSPEAERREQARAEQARIAYEQVAREQRAAIERDRERDRAERDKARRREQAFALLKAAVDAARTDRCAAAIELEPQIRELDPNVFDAWFARDPDIKRCMTPAPPPPPPPPPQQQPSQSE